MIEAWAFIDESGRVLVHPFAAPAEDVWEWVALKRLTGTFQGTIDRLKATGCRVARVRIEILEDGR